MEQPIKVLMFGWEFPPYNSGGLGVACANLIRALASKNIEITFVLPKKLPILSATAHLEFADEYLPGISITAVNSLLKPYLNSAEFSKLKSSAHNGYGLTLFEEVTLYALRAAELAKKKKFDVVHAHDWLSFSAGLAAKRVSGKPLVTHVHSTEFDRTGGGGNRNIQDIEQRGLQEADAVITVSGFTKKIVVDRYGIHPEKISVVHNGVDVSDAENKGAGDYAKSLSSLKSSGKKIVLFVGRITLQKGPDYFLRAASRVLEYYPNARFVIAGSGDMEWQIVREAAWLGISDKIIFAGFLRGDELEGLYRAADLFVMPSVSEPFGLTALEAIKNGTPVILSKQSGVSEVIQHAIKVDFWDVDAMADAIIGVLRRPSLSETMRENASRELPAISWGRCANACIAVYRKLIPRTG